jgi:hypothetical protein
LAEIQLEIHPSQVNSALLCELRLDEELWDKHPNYDMLRGSVFHSMVEASMRKGVVDAQKIIEDRLSDEYGTTIKDLGISPATFHQLALEARIAFEAWLEHVLPNINLKGVVTIEQEHRLSIGEYVDGDDLLEVVLVGSPDLIDAAPRIHDWKTANRVWDSIKLVGQAQPPLYNALSFGRQPRPFTFWIWEVPSSTWTPLSITPTVAQIDAALQLAFRVAIKRHLGLLTANPGLPGVYGKSRGWWCSPKYCQCWNKCEARKIYNDGNDDVIADWKEGWDAR